MNKRAFCTCVLGLWMGLMMAPLWADDCGCSSPAVTPPVVTAKGLSLHFKESLGTFGFALGQLHTPGRMAFMQQDLLVVDRRNRRVQRLTRLGQPVYGFQQVRDEDGALRDFSDPFAVAVDPRGGIYVSDVGENVVYVFDSLGRYERTLGQFSGVGMSFNQPAGVAVDVDGYLYVADTGNHRVLKLDSYGKRVWTIPPSEGALRSPSQVLVGIEGTVLVLDEMGVKVYDLYGRFLRTWVSVSGASGFAVDARGLLYMVFPQQGRLAVYGAKGELLVSVDEVFRTPIDVQVSGSRLWVVDAGRHQVDVWEIK